MGEINLEKMRREEAEKDKAGRKELKRKKKWDSRKREGTDAGTEGDTIEADGA